MKQILLLLARTYQRTLSYIVPVRCRFFPSCSHYFVEAVETHGAWKGLRLGLYRLLRCQPFSRGGYDPVPPRRDAQPQQGPQ